MDLAPPRQERARVLEDASRLVTRVRERCYVRVLCNSERDDVSLRVKA